MNRIAHLGMHRTLPRPSGEFTTGEAHELLVAYRKDPSDVSCPRCGPESIEVLAFVEIQVDPDGRTAVTAPEGDYAATLFCHRCRRGIGVRVGAQVD